MHWKADTVRRGAEALSRSYQRGNGMAQKATTTRLSAWRLAGDAYGLWFSNLGVWFVAAALPFALTVLIGFAFAQAPLMVGDGEDQRVFITDFTLVLNFLVDVIIYTLFGVAWHRWALLSERPRLIPNVGGEHLRFLVWALILMLLSQFVLRTVFGLFSGAASGLITALFAFSFSPQVLGFLAAVLACGYFLARVSVIYPAAALGDRLGLLGAWKMTRGNAWALFWAFVLVMVPLLFAFFLIGAIFSAAVVGLFSAMSSMDRAVTSNLAWFLMAAFSALASLAFLTLPIGVASKGYAELRRGQSGSAVARTVWTQQRGKRD